MTSNHTELRVKKVTLQAPKPLAVERTPQIHQDADHFVFVLNSVAAQFRAYSQIVPEVLLANLDAVCESCQSILDTRRLLLMLADEPEEGDCAVNDNGDAT